MGATPSPGRRAASHPRTCVCGSRRLSVSDCTWGRIPEVLGSWSCCGSLTRGRAPGYSSPITRRIVASPDLLDWTGDVPDRSSRCSYRTPSRGPDVRPRMAPTSLGGPALAGPGKTRCRRS